jgi:hypothetical protein
MRYSISLAIVLIIVGTAGAIAPPVDPSPAPHIVPSTPPPKGPGPVDPGGNPTTPPATPEPASLAIAGVGLAAGGIYRWLRRKPPV